MFWLGVYTLGKIHLQLKFPQFVVHTTFRVFFMPNFNFDGKTHLAKF